MRHLRVVTILFAMLVVAPVAKAGLYVEPLVAYMQGTTDAKTVAAFGGTESKTSQTGILFGGELGWKFAVGQGLRVGLEVATGSVDSKNDSTGVTSKFATMTTLLTIGYHFPEKIIGYVGIGNITATDDATPKTKSTGTILKLGGHREIIKHVSGGAEYQLHTWTEFETEGSASQKFTDVYEKYNASAIMGFVRLQFGDAGGK